jgi:hypothetical protein
MDFPEWIVNAKVIAERDDIKLALGSNHHHRGVAWIIQKVGDGPWLSLRAAWKEEIARYDAEWLRSMSITLQGDESEPT